MVSERTVADLQRRLLAAQSEAVNERDKRRNQVAERDRRIAELEKVLRLAGDHCTEMLADPKWHPIGKCPVLDEINAALAGKGVIRG